MSNLIIGDLTKFYKNNEVLKNFSLTVQEKNLITILGPSGCGKSTLLYCISGIEKPDLGNVILKDRVLFDFDSAIDIPLEKRNIGFVFQNYALWPHLKVQDHLKIPLKAKKFKKYQIEEKINSMLQLVGLENKKSHLPSQLSGGEQQRVALARALIMEPDLLLLDEPLSNLDALLREKMQLFIRKLQKKLGITTIFVTHDQREAASISDSVVIMNNGKIEQIGSFNEIKDNPKTEFVKNFII